MYGLESQNPPRQMSTTSLSVCLPSFLLKSWRSWWQLTESEVPAKKSVWLKCLELPVPTGWTRFLSNEQVNLRIDLRLLWWDQIYCYKGFSGYEKPFRVCYSEWHVTCKLEKIFLLLLYILFDISLLFYYFVVHVRLTTQHSGLARTYFVTLIDKTQVFALLSLTAYSAFRRVSE